VTGVELKRGGPATATREMGFERSSECAWFQNRIAGARDRGIPIPTPTRTKRAPGTPGLRGAHSCDKRFWASTEWGDSRAGPASDTGFETDCST